MLTIALVRTAHERDRKEIEEEILNSFSTLYSPTVLVKPFVEDIDWSPISPREDEKLVAMFSLDEIKKVFSCDGNKSLCADMFSLVFFKEN